MSREYYTIFQRRLDGLCKEKRWSREGLAMKLNLSEHTVNGYFKRGARLPADNILVQIAELFKVDKGYIRCDQEPRRLVSATIGDMTGLSPEAADTLVDTKKNPKAAAVLEAILTNPLYEEFIEDAYSYLYESSGTIAKEVSVHKKSEIIKPTEIAKIKKMLALDTFGRLMQSWFDAHANDKVFEIKKQVQDALDVLREAKVEDFIRQEMKKGKSFNDLCDKEWDEETINAFEKLRKRKKGSTGKAKRDTKAASQKKKQ